ncbi:MAG: hypothetical protein LBK22_04490, partial [Tannerella sp.]|nr:hypothetical protein [Tannerella sp.]
MTVKKVFFSLFLSVSVMPLAAQADSENGSGKQQAGIREHALTRLTDGQHDDMVLYFTSNSILDGDRRMIFIRTVDGCNNIWLLDMDSGEERQITYFTEKSPNELFYHQFHQNDFKALYIASVVLHSKTGIIYFVKDRKLWRFDLNGNGRVLTRLPAKTDIGQCHVNEQGTRLVMSTVEDRMFDAGS